MKIKNDAKYKKLVRLYNARIEKGIKYLDSEFKRDEWLAKLQILKLNLNNQTTCVCGQIFSAYCEATFKHEQAKNNKTDLAV